MENIIEQIEKEFPEMTNEFKKIQVEQYLLFCQKTHDYGVKNLSLGADLSKNEEDKKLSLTGIWFRLQDKINRLKQLVLFNKSNSVKGESISDTYIDLSNYSIISLIILRNKYDK